MHKILLVDDSAFSRITLKRILGEKYQIIEAANGEDGLRQFEHERPDLVVLDLTMPGMNGLEVLEKIKQLDPLARIVIGTADIQDYNRQKATELGAVGFISKPFQSETLLIMVEQALQSE